MSFIGGGGGGANVIIDDSGLRALEAQSPGNVDLAIGKLAMDAGGWAQDNIRTVNAIDTGFMVNTTRGRRIAARLWSVGTAAYYGVFIEYGTRFVAPRPWLMPAMQRARDTLNQVIGNAIRDSGR